jgi:GTP-binding protein
LPRPEPAATWRFAGAVSPGGEAPELRLPEIAFAGKSNVGKSSLINCLTGVPGLARTSRTPGRTQQINFFVGPERFVFADLPGYGFARVPISVRQSWKPLVEGYLRRRETLCALVIIVDARRGLGADDLALVEFIASCGRPAVVVANKIDKLRQGERVRAVRELAASGQEVLVFSAVTGEGRRELWARLAELARLR